MKNHTGELSNKKSLRTFAAAAFFNDLGSDMIYPIWPLFLTSVLGANMMVLGLIDGLGEALVAVSQSISGYWSDRLRKRKIFIWTGYLFGTVSRIGYAVSTTWLMVIPFKVLDRAGKIRGAPRDAIIADITTESNRGKSFGLLRTMDNLGAVFGILICMLLFERIGFRNLFIVAALPSIIGVGLIILLVKERKAESVKTYKGIMLKGLDRNLKLLFLLSGVFSLGAFSYSFLMVFASKLGFKPMFLPLFYLVFTGAAALSSLPFGKAADIFGRKIVLITAFILWALVCMVLFWAKSFTGLCAAFILYGLHKGALEPVQKTIVADLAPPMNRAGILGAYQMIIGLFALPASLIAGSLWEIYGAAAPLSLSMLLTVLSVVMLFFVDTGSKQGK